MNQTWLWEHGDYIKLGGTQRRLRLYLPLGHQQESSYTVCEMQCLSVDGLDLEA